jgi:CheY-like chemotaxis protein
MIVELIRQALESQLGCEVVTARNGTEALEAAREMEFEAILVDYLMPRMDGGELYRRLRVERPELSSRFMFMTGDILSDRTLQDIESTGCRVLVKPFGLPELTQAVGELLRASTASRTGTVVGARVAG